MAPRFVRKPSLVLDWNNTQNSRKLQNGIIRLKEIPTQLGSMSRHQNRWDILVFSALLMAAK